MELRKIGRLLEDKISHENRVSDCDHGSFYKLLRKALFAPNGRAKALNRLLKRRYSVDPQFRFPLWQVILLGRYESSAPKEIDEQLEVVMRHVKRDESHEHDRFFCEKFELLALQLTKDLKRRENEVFGGEGFKFVAIDEDFEIGWDKGLFEAEGDYAPLCRATVLVFALCVYRSSEFRYVQVI